MVHIIEIGCAQNCHKALENCAKIGLFGAHGGRNLKKVLSSNSRPKFISFESIEHLLSLLRSWEMLKNSYFGKKKSTALWQLCMQRISIICNILNSRIKGLSILNVSAGSVKIQLTLCFTIHAEKDKRLCNKTCFVDISADFQHHKILAVTFEDYGKRPWNVTEMAKNEG